MNRIDNSKRVEFFRTPVYADHLRNVLADAEFIKAAASIRQAEFDDDSLLTLVTTSPENIDIITDTEIPGKPNYDALKKLAEKYLIRPIDIVFSKLIKSYPGNRQSIVESHYVLTQNDIGYSLWISKDITQKDFLQIWKDFKIIYALKERGNHPVTRNRAPENTKLLYAIFKARSELTFRQIFDLYASGILVGVEGKQSVRFSTAKELENYYHLYYP